MSAEIIPFKRPALKEPPTVRPPIVLSFGDQYATHAAFIGSKEELIAWGIADEQQFPIPPKRMAHHAKASVIVNRIKGGAFRVSLHATDDIRLAARIRQLVNDTLQAAPPSYRETTLVLRAIDEWRGARITQACDGYRAGLLEPLDRAIHAFQTAAVEMVSHRLPPDETEPEHEQ